MFAGWPEFAVTIYYIGPVGGCFGVSKGNFLELIFGTWCVIYWGMTSLVREIKKVRSDKDIIILNEVSQTEKDRYCVLSLACGI